MRPLFPHASLSHPPLRSLLTLGSVISTLAENSAKNKADHVPFRNSKLTRMLQPSLSGNARISVICTINPDSSAVAESTSTLLFAQRIKRVQLHAQKKEVVDTDALLERYRKEIEELRKRLAEKEASQADGGPVLKRRLSAREQLDESLAMHNLNARIKQLTKLILTSQTVDENKGDESRPASPMKVDFDMSPYQVRLRARATVKLRRMCANGFNSSNRSSSRQGGSSRLRLRRSCPSRRRSRRDRSSLQMRPRARRTSC